ncbi:hypothetical protein SDC9_167007 [bioreactor metagenome]|uniref:Uncharacterized protein n=1 Tax=bioreactor metagenome TaxID=1076179 RepID=A0A645FYY5_9ZZZZ
MIFAVHRIHAVEHRHPVLRFGAARARVQRKHGVARIIRSLQKRFKPERLGLFLKLVKFRRNFAQQRFIVFLLGKLDERLNVLGLGHEFIVFAQLTFY